MGCVPCLNALMSFWHMQKKDQFVLKTCKVNYCIKPNTISHITYKELCTNMLVQENITEIISNVSLGLPGSEGGPNLDCKSAFRIISSPTHSFCSCPLSGSTARGGGKTLWNGRALDWCYFASRNRIIH